MAPTFKIERIEKQEGPEGTFIPMPPTAANPDGVTYHFAPDGAGRFVAEISDVAHYTRFLSLTNAFRLVDEEDQAPAATDAGTQGEDGGGAVPPPAVATDDLAGADLGTLRKIFKAELDRNPSPRSTPETLIEQIKAKRAEAAAQ